VKRLNPTRVFGHGEQRFFISLSLFLLLGASTASFGDGNPVFFSGKSTSLSQERLTLHSINWWASTRRSPGSEAIVVQNHGPLELRFSLVDGSSDIRLAPDSALALPCEDDGHAALANIGDSAGINYLVSLSCGDVIQFSLDDSL